MSPLLIVQARMGSQRLPGKVLADIQGRPLLAWLLERLAPAKRISGLLVATTVEARDDAIERLCQSLGVQTYRGSPHDVLGRYAAAAREADATSVIRISGDSPLLDHEVVDLVVDEFDAGGADLVQNHRPAAWPVGTAVEVMTAQCLAELDRRATAAHHREHVTLYAYETDGSCSVRFAEPPPALRAPDLRLCVDTDEDLRRVRELCAAFAPRTDVSVREIIEHDRTARAA